MKYGPRNLVGNYIATRKSPHRVGFFVSSFILFFSLFFESFGVRDRIEYFAGFSVCHFDDDFETIRICNIIYLIERAAHAECQRNAELPDNQSRSSAFCIYKLFISFCPKPSPILRPKLQKKTDRVPLPIDRCPIPLSHRQCSLPLCSFRLPG